MDSQTNTNNLAVIHAELFDSVRDVSNVVLLSLEALTKLSDGDVHVGTELDLGVTELLLSEDTTIESSLHTVFNELEHDAPQTKSIYQWLPLEVCWRPMVFHPSFFINDVIARSCLVSSTCQDFIPWTRMPNGWKAAP
ncbi:hypothetical protein D3C85_899170 [compost metagenome]